MGEMCEKISNFVCFDAMFTQMSYNHPGYRSWFHLRDWSRSGGSYGNNTRVICCPVPGRPESAEIIWPVIWIVLHNSGITVSIHQSPSLCNAIHITGPCLLAIMRAIDFDKSECYVPNKLSNASKGNIGIIESTVQCSSVSMYFDRRLVSALHGNFNIDFNASF